MGIETDTPSRRRTTWVTGKSRFRACWEEALLRPVSWGAVCCHKLFGGRIPDDVAILMYHRVADSVRGVPAPSINVTPQRFRQQLTQLLELGFRFWPLKQVLAYRETGKVLPEGVAVITFDDGFECVYTRAVPVLRELEVPATVFVSTGYLGQSGPFPFDAWGVAQAQHVAAESYRPMTRQQCRELSWEGLIEIGAHTHRHEDYRGRPETLRKDLVQCVDVVKEITGQTEVTFAFPYGTPNRGFASPDLVGAARQTGVVCGLTTGSHTNELQDDPFTWGRFHVFDWDNGHTLAAKLTGWYSWAPELRQRLIGNRVRCEYPIRQGLGRESAEGEEVDTNSRTALADAATIEREQVRGSSSCEELVPSAATVAPAALVTASPERPLISVIVPTFNREEWIGEAVRSLNNQQTRSEFEIEVIVVDNDSNDETRHVVEQLASGKDVTIRYVHQSKPGDAPTRNAGINEASGEWLAFFDDDQLADPNWIWELYQTARQKRARIVGGPVHLDLTDQQLSQLGKVCRHSLRETRLYSHVRRYREQDLPGTGNALVAREVFKEVGTFDESMTHGGSDSDFFLRARRHGYALWYSPNASIRHRIAPSRLTPAYFRWDALSGGASHKAHFDYQEKGMLGLLLGCGLRCAYQSVVNLPLLVIALLRNNRGQVLDRKTLVWRTEGYVRKTLAILAPNLFQQRAFFESLEFRKGRETG